MSFNFVRVIGPTRNFVEEDHSLRLVLAAFNGKLNVEDAAGAFDAAYEQLRKANRTVTSGGHREHATQGRPGEGALPDENFLIGYVEENTEQRYWVVFNPGLINTGPGGRRGTEYIVSTDPEQRRQEANGWVRAPFPDMDYSFADDDAGGWAGGLYPH
jgi:hypothetical protein